MPKSANVEVKDKQAFDEDLRTRIQQMEEAKAVEVPQDASDDIEVLDDLSEGDFILLNASNSQESSEMLSDMASQPAIREAQNLLDLSDEEEEVETQNGDLSEYKQPEYF